jgi:uncharacterized membrane protein
MSDLAILTKEAWVEDIDELAERFKGKFSVDEATGCWLWVGSTTKGYGSLHTSRGVPAYAHRVSFAIHNPGVSLSGMVVCHRCDTPRCVNPSHLFLGTPQDNMRDAWEKGRVKLPSKRSSGERHKNAKLSDADVLEIRRQHKLGISQGSLAKKFNVSTSTVSQIVKNLARKEVK